MEEKSNKKTRKQPQNILCQFLLIQPNAKKKKKKNAKTELEAWNLFIRSDILDLILLYKNNYIDSLLSQFHEKEMLKE